MARPGRGRRGGDGRAGDRAVAERPAARPPRDPQPPRRPVPRARYRRRRLAALLIGLVVLVGLGFGVRVLLYDSGLFDVEAVEVAGLVTLQEDDVRAAAGVPLHAPLAAIDTDAVAERVAALPPVESVHVGRSWPHTVAVTVTERVPVATVSTSQGPALVDRTGVVYRGAPAPDLPRLVTSPRTGDPATLAAVAVLTSLPDELHAQVESVGASVVSPGAPGQVTLRLADGKEVRWGTPERAEEKAATLSALLTQPGTVYDVTSPDLPTIRR
ncbi:MAG TPA: FtsQ-type POTRA domain-containing protein [Pseudonocardia sp.]|jgi:cell division protein FtsQ|uniref:cell division protein FtsQ/DivIB n=1 Tax=Pseudonocardia sp. TaxID=60912 RepID=UPI002B4B16B0|nr:FtsQ-type POTRA domain-containing protein [Pseudonocardia sp.]HLU59020.1 FtsQ-type POTRA domain-containing protein [Pseudonocardia sp.]